MWKPFLNHANLKGLFFDIITHAFFLSPLRSDFAFSKMNASACALVFASSWPFSGPRALLPQLLESLSTRGPCLSLCLPSDQNSHCCQGCISDTWLIMSPPLIQMEIIYARVDLDWNMNSWEANIILYKWWCGTCHITLFKNLFLFPIFLWKKVQANLNVIPSPLCFHSTCFF